MSASSVMTWTVRCDHTPCPARVSGADGEHRDSVRRFLRSQGWAVGVCRGLLVSDYCPAHKQAPEATAETEADHAPSVSAGQTRPVRGVA